MKQGLAWPSGNHNFLPIMKRKTFQQVLSLIGDVDIQHMSKINGKKNLVDAFTQIYGFGRSMFSNLCGKKPYIFFP